MTQNNQIISSSSGQEKATISEVEETVVHSTGGNSVISARSSRFANMANPQLAIFLYFIDSRSRLTFRIIFSTAGFASLIGNRKLLKSFFNLLIFSFEMKTMLF